MELHYTLNSEDYIRYHMYIQKHSEKHRQWLIKSRILFSAVMAALLAVGLYIAWGKPTAWLIAIAVVVIWLWAFPKESRKTVEKIVNESLSKPENRKYMGEQSLSFEEEKAVYKVGEEVDEIPYQNFSQAIWDDGRLYLCFGTAGALIVPAKAFQTEGQQEQIEKYLEKKIGTPEKAPQE